MTEKKMLRAKLAVFALSLMLLGGIGVLSNLRANEIDCSSPQQPIVDALATVVETAVRTCGRGINISHTYCSRHGDSIAHSEKRAVDIGRVDGEKVGLENESAKRLQQILHDMSRVDENLGPFLQERRNADGVWTSVDVEPGEYEDFIHISVAP